MVMSPANEFASQDSVQIRIPTEIRSAVIDTAPTKDTCDKSRGAGSKGKKFFQDCSNFRDWKSVPRDVTTYRPAISAR